MQTLIRHYIAVSAAKTRDLSGPLTNHPPETGIKNPRVPKNKIQGKTRYLGGHRVRG